MPIPFSPIKSLGQNFLQDQNIIRKIVDALDAPENALVLEIGPGGGALTEHLLKRYPRLIALDKDQRAVDWLKKRYPHADIRLGDILDFDWSLLDDEAVYVIGNLPYYITSEILFGLLAQGKQVRRAVMMVQLEVAQRIVAAPRSKAYGILSVLTQLSATPKILFKVSRHVFIPKPEVESAVIAIENIQETIDERLRKVVRTAFNQRRKTLRNSLKSLGQVPNRWAEKRAEELEPTEFVELTHALFGL